MEEKFIEQNIYQSHNLQKRECEEMQKRRTVVGSRIDDNWAASWKREVKDVHQQSPNFIGKLLYSTGERMIGFSERFRGLCFMINE